MLISLRHLHVLEEKLKVVTSASVHFGLKGKLELLQLEEKEKLFQGSRLDWQRHLLLHLLAVPCEYLDEDQQDVDVVWDVQQGEAGSIIKYYYVLLSIVKYYQVLSLLSIIIIG